MAPFNPEPPKTNDPNYLGYSHPISPFEGDKSTGLALSGIGDVLGMAVKGADNFVKGIIDNAVYSGVDTQREGLTGALETKLGIPPNQQVADVHPDYPSGEAAGSTLNVLPQNTTDLPNELQNLDRSAGNLTNASAARNIPNTYYWGRLDVLAKDLRNQYPGYRDYIDTKVSQVSGGNPANQYMHLLLQSAAAAAGGDKSNLEKARTELLKHTGEMGGTEDKVSAAEMMHRINSGVYSDPTAAVMTWASKKDAVKAHNKAIVDNWNAENADAESHKLHAGVVISQLSANKVKEIWNDSMGAVPGMSVKTLEEFTAKVMRGDLPMTEDQALKLGYALAAKISQGRISLLSSTRTQGGDRNQSLADVYGDGETNKRIDAGLEVLTELSKRLINGKPSDLAIVGYTAKHIEATVSDAKSEIMKDPKIANKVITLKIANDFGGPAVANYLAADALGAGFAGDLSVLFDHQRASMIDPNQNYSIKDSILDAYKHKVGLPPEPGDVYARPTGNTERGYYDKILQWPSKVLNNPKVADDIKITTAHRTYDPKNVDLIGLFDKGDHQTQAFSYLTSKDVIAGLTKIRSKDPASWDLAKNWADKTFRNELFTTSIRNLGKYATTPDVKIMYNPDDSSFHATYVPGANITNPVEAARSRARGPNLQAAYVQDLQHELDNLNAGIKGVANFIKMDKGDVNAYVLSTMINAGLDPKTIVGIPAEMMQTLIAGKNAVAPFNTNTKKNQSRAP
jgi:hypothetical protein